MSEMEKQEQEPTKEETTKDDERGDGEETMLKTLLEKYDEPGCLVAAVGPTTVMVMFNLSLGTQTNPTRDGILYATNMLDGSDALEGKSLLQQVELVLERARAADRWNRTIEMGGVLNAAFSAFNGLWSVVWSDDKRAEGKSVPSSTKTGARITHSSTVSGLLALGKSIKGGTKALLPDAWRLQELIPQLHTSEPTLHIGTSCWKVTVIDARSWTASEGASEDDKDAVKDEGGGKRRRTEDDKDAAQDEGGGKRRRTDAPVFPTSEEICNFEIRAPADDK